MTDEVGAIINYDKQPKDCGDNFQECHGIDYTSMDDDSRRSSPLTPAKHSPKVVLKSIKVEGFKSFRDSVYVDLCPSFDLKSFNVESDALFTCIIGGNGVGKSALVDAVLFVLGQCASQLRSQRVEQLINDDVSVATVNITFQQIFPGQSSVNEIKKSLTVSRVVTTGSDRSSYLLNSQSITRANMLDEVCKFCGANIDNPDRFVMRQGATLLAQRSSSELLAFFEELAGTALLKNKIGTIELLLDKIALQISVLEEKEMTLVARRHVLKPHIEKFEQYQVEKNDLEQLRATVIFNEAIEHRHHAEFAENEAKTCMIALETSTSKVENMKKLFDSASKEYGDAVFEAAEMSTCHKSALVTEKLTCTSAASLRAKQERSVVEIHAKETEKKRVFSIESKSKKELDALYNRLSKLEAEKMALESGAECLELNSASSNSIQTAENNYPKLNLVSRSEFDTNQDEQSKKKILLEQKLAHENELLFENQGRLSNAQLEFRNVSDLVQSKRSTLTHVQSELESCEEDTDFTESFNSTGENSANQDSEKRTSGSPEERRICAMRSLVQSLCSKYDPQCFLGILKDLVWLNNSEVSLAVNAVLGGRLRNTLVVQSRTDASVLLDAAESWLGVLRCDILDEISMEISKVPESYPTGLSLLSNYITGKDARCTALLRNKIMKGWLLAKQKQDAIAAWNYNVVTLDGILYRADGEIASISSNIYRSEFSLTTRDSKLDRKNKMSYRTPSLRANRSSLEQRIKRLTVEVSELVTFQAEATDVVKECSNMINKCMNRIEALRQDILVVEAAIASNLDNKKTMEEFNKKNEKLKMFAVNKATPLQLINGEITKLKSRIKCLETRIEGQNMAKEMAYQALEKAQKLGKKLLDDLNDAENKNVEANQALKKAAKEKRAKDKEVQAKKQHFDDIQEKFSALKNKVSTCRKDIQEAQNRHTVALSRYEETLKNISEDRLQEIHSMNNEEFNIFQEKISEAKILLRRREKSVSNLEHSLNADAIEENCFISKEQKKIAAELKLQKQKCVDFRKEKELLEKERYTNLVEALEKVNEELNAAYSILTPSEGECYLSYSTDPVELVTGGVMLKAKPMRGASWRSIDKLSGGQQALCGLALSLATQRAYPSCLYIMDELDAALDVNSVAKAADLLAKRATQAQYIVVSHRAEMRERCSAIVGLYRYCGSASAICVPIL